MDGPLGSSLDQYTSTGTASRSRAEESGWTTYFDDFLSEQRKKGCFLDDDDDDDSHGSPSLVSDAASPSYKEVDDDDACDDARGKSILQIPKSLNVKKRRNKKYACNDLEDTASSPVNSPKVCNLKEIGVIDGTSDEVMENFQDKDSGNLVQEHDQLERVSSQKVNEWKCGG